MHYPYTYTARSKGEGRTRSRLLVFVTAGGGRGPGGTARQARPHCPHCIRGNRTHGATAPDFPAEAIAKRLALPTQTNPNYRLPALVACKTVHCTHTALFSASTSHFGALLLSSFRYAVTKSSSLPSSSFRLRSTLFYRCSRAHLCARPPVRHELFLAVSLGSWLPAPAWVALCCCCCCCCCLRRSGKQAVTESC